LNYNIFKHSQVTKVLSFMKVLFHQLT